MRSDVSELLTKLRQQEVRIWAEGDRLRCSAPKGVLTPALQAEITGLKAELLDFLRRTQRVIRGADIPLRPVPRTGPLPASFGQQRLWFLQELDPHSYAYNIPGAVRIHGPLDIPALERTLSAIVERHETLRTTFQLSGGSLLQVIGAAMPLHLAPVDLSHLPADQREEEVRAIVRGEARRPFHLATGPHWRIALLRLGEEEHVLVIIQHHIISDGWSLGIFVRELGELYEANVAGRPSPLQPLSIQYADYASWQRRLLESDLMQEHLAFWKRHLDGALPTMNLPTDRPRPALQTLNGSYQAILLPSALAGAVEALSQQEGATLFMTLLAAFKVLLYRYTRQTDLIVGTSNGNRHHVETESLIGFFVNTLALRSDLSGDPTFRELLGRVRCAALDAYDHQELPFEQLVEHLQPVRDLSRSPVFQVMFILHNTPTERLQLQNLTLSGVECDIGAAKFDLTLSATNLNIGLAVVMEYNTDLFDAATIRRMLGHWQVLLEELVKDPGQRVSELTLLTTAERQRILIEWNRTAADWPEETLCDLWSQQVARSPQAVAIEAAGTMLTYRDADARATRLAQRLAIAGARRGTVVGVQVDRSADMVIALLAILRTGAAYLPLDPELPPKRRSYILADSGVSVVVTDGKAGDELKENAFRVVRVFDLASGDELPADPPVAVPSRPEPDDPAYLMYTSGSTGQPKAVVVAHRAVVNFLRSMREYPGIQPEDVLLAVTSLTFDISVLEVFLPLITGARLAIADRQSPRDPQRLARLLDSSRATLMQATPATWRMLVESGWPGQPSLKALCGGENLPKDLAEDLLDRCQSLWNMYGPTETTVWSTVHPVARSEPTVPIGHPIHNTQVYLLDARLQPVPVGVPGEMYIGGQGVAQGYFRRPGLTAERFIPDPFGSQPGRRLYRTGDSARYLPGGRIEFLGRTDFQVKVRGVRIELPEIEATVRRLADVRDCAVVARKEGAADPRLVAYVVPRHGHSLNVSTLRAQLAEELPASMQPAAFVMLPTLPLTPSGKVDRQALPLPEHERPDLERPYVEPRDDTERAILAIWQRLLPVNRVGIYDNFFDLGGHSLLLVQMQRLLEEETGGAVSVVDLFRFPTVAAIANFLRSGARPADAVTQAAQRGAAQRQAFGRPASEGS